MLEGSISPLRSHDGPTLDDPRLPHFADKLKSPDDCDKSKAGLRDLASVVLNTVKEAGTTTYIEVANRLVEGWQREEDPLSEMKSKNIRRRVYDALNVLLAIGVITKEKKKIRWVGFPNGDAEVREETRLLEEKATLMNAIKQSHAELEDLRDQINAYHSLIVRNSEVNHTDSAVQPNLLYFPFLMLTTPQHEIGITIEDDETRYWLDVPGHFEIRDDSYVLQRLH